MFMSAGSNRDHPSYIDGDVRNCHNGLEGVDTSHQLAREYAQGHAGDAVSSAYKAGLRRWESEWKDKEIKQRENDFLPANGIALANSDIQHNMQMKPVAMRIVAIMNVPNPADNPEHHPR
jgi:hypothetical protein